MKKKLLLIASLALFALSSNAQDKVWDFSDTAVWTSTTGVSTSTPNYLSTGLDIISSGSTVGTIAASTVNYGDFTSSRAMVFANVTGPAPTNRAVSFPVTGTCTVTIWVTTSSTSRTAFMSDGTNVIGSFVVTSSSPKFGKATGAYTGGAGTVYIYCNNTMSIAKITVTYPPLGTDSFKAESSVNVYSNGSQVFVSNVKSNTTVAVYGLNGALFKTIETSSDASFDLASGVYVAKVKSEEGEKSVKLLVK